MNTKSIGSVVITHDRTSTVSRFWEVDKAVENLYYMLLLSGPDYAEKSGRWARWAKIGFDVTVKEPPRDVSREDRVQIDTNPADAPRIPISLRSGNAHVASKLVELIQRMEHERAGTSITGDGRTAAILASPSIREILGDPLEESLRKDGLDGSQIEEFRRLVHHVVEVLTEDNVASLSAAT